MSPIEILALADKIKLRPARVIVNLNGVKRPPKIEVKLLLAERDAIVQGLQLLAMNR